MFCYWSGFLLVTLVWQTHGETLQSITVSQETFGAIAIKMVVTNYQILLNESNSIESEITACDNLTSKDNSSCHSCVHSHALNCIAGSAALAKFFAASGPMAALGIELGLHLEILGNEIANGANALFTKYGPSALSGLQNGFNAIGSGFSSLGDSLKDVFSSAYDAMKKAFSAIANIGDYMSGFWDILTGKRRKRGVSSLSKILQSRENIGDQGPTRDSEVLSREKRESIKQCLDNACPICIKLHHSAGNNDTYEIYRKICGDALVNTYISIENQIKHTAAFYNLLTNSTVDILKEVWVEPTTEKVSKFVAYDGTKYVTYHPSQIIFQPFNGDALYTDITEYLIDLF